jgi:hypothetical protein
MADAGELLTRVQKLESENRKIKWLGGALALFLAVIVFFMVRSGNRNKLEVTELVVKDRRGNVVARLGSADFGTCLELTGYQGATNARVCVDNVYGSYLNLENRKPEARAFLSAGETLREPYGKLVPGLIIQGETGRGMLSVNVGPETAALVIGRSPDDSAVVLSTGQNKPSLRVLGSDGKAVWTAP